VGQTIWYMDETSTNLWERPRRIWQPCGGTRVKLSKQHKHNITIVGALSHGRFFARLAPTTNKDTVHAFFQQMAEAHDLTGAVIVLDNHRAHLSGKVTELFAELRCELLFLPPASSVLNPIEVLWAQVKRQWRQCLLTADVARIGESWMAAQLSQICRSFDEQTLVNLARVHLHDAIQILEEAA
jgi:transposase